MLAPSDLIDRNVRIDYGKLKHLIVVDKNGTITTNGNFSKLKEILEEGKISSKIEKGFPLEKLAAKENFISLLFYFGLLTIQGSELNEFVLSIPNETINRLYYDYIRDAYADTDIFSVELSKYAALMKEIAVNGKWRPFFLYIADRMSDSIGLRDLMTGEKSIQAFLNVYLGLSNLYMIHPERELNKGFADIVMEPFLARYEEINYTYLLEIKYIKRSGNSSNKTNTDDQIQKLKSEAIQQLNRDCLDNKFQKAIRSTTLIKLVLIFHGHQLVAIESVE